jgi:arylsulfatase
MNTKRALLILVALGISISTNIAAADQKPNVVILMADDVGWNDFGAYTGGGAALGHPTPNIDKVAKEGALFTNWYGQASCTAGRASFMTGRIPIRTALSVVVVPGDLNGLKKETPTIAEFYKKNGYKTYFSGKWHLGDKPEMYPIEHGFDEMKNFAAYYPGVYSYSDLSPNMHPWFPKYNEAFWKEYQETVNLYEWSGSAGKKAHKEGLITYDNLAEFDVRQTDSAVAYIKENAKGNRPFFMDVNFMKMHNPTNPAKAFKGKTHLGNYSDSMLELDSNIGRIMDIIRTEAPNTIVIITSDNGAWQDAYPDAGTTPFRGEKGTAFEAGWRVPGILWAPGKVPPGQILTEMMSHLDIWPTTASLVGINPPKRGEYHDNNGKPIYFDGMDNSQYITGQTKHSIRNDWIYISGESFGGVRADIGDDPNSPELKISWKAVYTSKDTWLGPELNMGLPAVYNLTMDPFEKYDMLFNGSVATRNPTSSPGRFSGQDNGWTSALTSPIIIDFNKSIIKYPNMRRVPGGASNDLIPNLQDPGNPVPAMDPYKAPKTGAMGG